jgi:prophage tail gpP-like protein
MNIEQRFNDMLQGMARQRNILADDAVSLYAELQQAKREIAEQAARIEELEDQIETFWESSLT